MMDMDGGSSALASRLTAGTTRACNSHSQAERRRRQRINNHLATLRTLLPAATKMDKATLLGEVVRQVRELHGMATRVTEIVPTEENVVRIEENGATVRAWVCCEDRPSLMGELGRAVWSVRARAVRAEIVTIRGRARSELEVEVSAGDSLSALHAALQEVSAVKGPSSVDLVREKYKQMQLYSLSASS